MKAVNSSVKISNVLVVTLVTLVTSISRADELSVELVSGRHFTGQVDPRTDDETLWLRYGSHNITVLRPILWKRVVNAQHEGRDVNVDALAELAQQIKTPPPENQPTIDRLSQPRASSTSFAEQAGHALAASPRVHSVAFDTFIANWDSDVEADGLVVRIYPVGGDGRVLPINGSVAVDLTAIRTTSFYGHPRGRGQVVDKIGTWTKAVRADSSSNRGLEFRLPFQARHPEFATDIGSYGLVHIRLVVPGHGVFEASQDAVRIRQFAPLRDQLQQTTGERFLPNERTGR